MAAMTPSGRRTAPDLAVSEACPRATRAGGVTPWHAEADPYQPRCGRAGAGETRRHCAGVLISSAGSIRCLTGGRDDMANDTKTVRRILQLRMRAPTPDIAQMLAFAKAAIPFYEAFGNTKVRLLRNVDDQAQFIQEIEYQTEASLELNRQKVASDPTLQGYLRTWRSMFPGAVELDVYEDVTDGG
jgi:hypothetical protein